MFINNLTKWGVACCIKGRGLKIFLSHFGPSPLSIWNSVRFQAGSAPDIHNHVAQLGIFEGRGLTNTTGTLNILLGECILKSYFLDLEAKEIAWEFSGFHLPPFVTKIISPVTLLIQIH